MKITISCECNSPTEAKSVLDRIATVGNGAAQYLSPTIRAEITAEFPPKVDHDKSIDDATESKLVVTKRINVSPGEPSIGKIGTDNKEWIINELKVQARIAAHFGNKYAEHCKLLWKRGEIKYDGKEYYL